MTFIIKAPLMTGTCELINCERINFVIHYTIQTMTLDFCKSKFFFLDFFCFYFLKILLNE